ncbi:ABC transporter permease [Commensalibacter nepenthis]|uniref:ABC transporter permease n=1 Tax=Commensalibacter nepenthis TaxID=3043872 RepID=A0ABT6QAR3_9PROT|nr:ABC transporter permease [Commensalibacter sp. TBRC 10068]MDI2113842.1 ABC transporter permease [Commensalibacter sp. TBRC 10068]
MNNIRNSELILFDNANLSNDSSKNTTNKKGKLIYNKLRRYFSCVLILIAWQLSCSLGLINTSIFVSPVTIFHTMEIELFSGNLLVNLYVSLSRIILGFTFALIFGVIFGFWAGLTKIGEDIIHSPLEILRNLPTLALVPLFVFWFGIGEPSKIILISVGAFFPIYFCLYNGIKNIEPKLLELARTINLDRKSVLFHIIFYGTLPDLLQGIRYSIGVSWLMLVVAEQVNTDSGIGFMIMQAQEFSRIDIIIFGLIIYGSLGLLSDFLIRLVEERILTWHPSFCKDA